MDDAVLRGMAKWPNVPAVYGWLSLDRRGHWLIKGERVGNPLVSAFIGRNYEQDEHGRWFFQNGPQRVFVTLDYTPFVYRVVSAEGAPLALECHTGAPVTTVSGAWLDENGALLLETEHGIGLVHDRDLDRLPPHLIDMTATPLAEDALDELMKSLQMRRRAPLWLAFRGNTTRIEPINTAEVPRRFGFLPTPKPPGGEDASKNHNGQHSQDGSNGYY
ncbi:MAG: DUF2946 family protein [Betaproteobacteria bacterium]|nr:DUF2946 family protein [Betaproteobacteria bacterium]